MGNSGKGDRSARGRRGEVQHDVDIPGDVDVVGDIGADQPEAGDFEQVGDIVWRPRGGSCRGRRPGPRARAVVRTSGSQRKPAPPVTTTRIAGRSALRPIDARTLSRVLGHGCRRAGRPCSARQRPGSRRGAVAPAPGERRGGGPSCRELVGAARQQPGRRWWRLPRSCPQPEAAAATSSSSPRVQDEQGAERQARTGRAGRRSTASCRTGPSLLPLVLASETFEATAVGEGEVHVEGGPTVGEGADLFLGLLDDRAGDRVDPTSSCRQELLALHARGNPSAAGPDVDILNL